MHTEFFWGKLFQSSHLEALISVDYINIVVYRPAAKQRLRNQQSISPVSEQWLSKNVTAETRCTQQYS
jgi:hypothetical protein